MTNRLDYLDYVREGEAHATDDYNRITDKRPSKIKLFFESQKTTANLSNRRIMKRITRGISQDTVENKINTLIRGLQDVFYIRTDTRMPSFCGETKTLWNNWSSTDQIVKNVNELKRKLSKKISPFYQCLYSDINKIPVQELTRKDPLASSYKVTNDSNKANNFILEIVEDICKEFVLNFFDNNIYNMLSNKLIHDRTWKESEKKILHVVEEVLNTLKDIWINLAFTSEMGPINLHTLERQSIANTNRRGDSLTGRYLDITFVIKYLDVFFELMYKDQFRIVEVQIAGDTLHLNILIRDKANVHRYYHIQLAKIPVQFLDENVLVTEIAELRKENAELKQIIEENAKREAENINLKVELEKNKKDITKLSAENSELKARIIKLEQIWQKKKLIKIANSKPNDVVNRDRLKRCICQDNGIFLLEVWYDEKSEIVIPERIQKIKSFVNQASKFFDLQ
ncbi:hypothetical protein Glove_311g20 [Diversispora epigaea]|uniref:Uncharacterized protein n=1 Tax=Diversispora epigaea TaxID=1348612 RepID=A0A397HX34_9GLOM|nr:hypothetical protein Glove_311g20 [Diversispora epigaea]